MDLKPAVTFVITVNFCLEIIMADTASDGILILPYRLYISFISCPFPLIDNIIIHIFEIKAHSGRINSESGNVTVINKNNSDNILLYHLPPDLQKDWNF